MKLEVGKEYRTRGGWKCVVIWVTKKGFASLEYGTVVTATPNGYAIHRPKEDGECGPIYHHSDGTAHAGMSINEPPMYDCGHPADIIEEWSDVDE